jgi:argininosuccinate lyase
VFAAFDMLDLMLPVLAGAVQTMTFKADRMAAALDSGMLATDLAEHLARQGVPFRETHGIAGRAVRRALELGVNLDELPAVEWRDLWPGLEDALDDIFNFDRAVARRSVSGGTSPAAVRAQLEEAKRLLQSRQFEQREIVDFVTATP